MRKPDAGSPFYVQDGDPFAQYPDDADVPDGESEVTFRIRAATEIKGIGNELYKKARHLRAVLCSQLHLSFMLFCLAVCQQAEVCQ